MSALLWGNPFAWLGAAAVLVPILVHLLATTRARRMPFPTLRFLPDSVPAAMRARRIEDAGLLLLRCLIVLAAVAALAQPWLALDGRAGGAGVRRIVVVDTSTSMSRGATGGGTAIDAARAHAATLADEGDETIIIESDDLAAGIAAAALRLADAMRPPSAADEVVLLSDFQRGALEGADLQPLAADTGVRLYRIEIDAAGPPEMPAWRAGERIWTATVELPGDATVARWQAATAAGAGAGAFESVVSPTDLAAARATGAAAARTVAVPVAAASSPERPLIVVWPGAAERAQLRAQAGPPDEPWMAEAVAALPADGPFSTASLDGRLLLFVDAAPGSLAAAELLAALRSSAGDPGALDELEPEVIDTAALRSWERAAGARPVAAGSDARAVWLLVLGLLILEQWWRGRAARRTAGDGMEGSDVR